MKNKNKRTEEASISILRDFLGKNEIDYQLSENDKTAYTDGIISIDSKDCAVQIKGTAKGYLTHPIEREYFVYALSNFLIYFIVDNITNGISSPNWNAYYKVFSLEDIERGISNKTTMLSKYFNFKKLDDIKIFIADINKEYYKFIARENEGINPKGLLDSGRFNPVKFIVQPLFEKNYVDIKSLKLKFLVVNDIELDRDVYLKINSESTTNISWEGGIESKQISIPSLNIKVPFRHSQVTNCSELKYKNLDILFKVQERKIDISIDKYNINPFVTEEFNEYIEILKHLKDIFSFVGVDDFLDGLIDIYKKSMDFRMRLIENDLYKEKYKDIEVLDYFYKILYNTTKRENSQTPRFLSMTVTEGKYCILYEDKDKCKILPSFSPLTIERQDGIRIKGALTWFLHPVIIENFRVARSWRNCVTFDYIQALEDDRKGLEIHYLDEEVGHIIFNYLLIYWENNHSEEMLNKLLDIIEPRITTTQNDILKFNGLQIKKVLEIPFNDEEIEYLSDRYDKEDEKINKLCYSISLDRKTESERLYNKLSSDDLTKFKQWAIYYLYEKLCKK
jgi:hypothetical protein